MNDKQKEALVILQEECAEVIQVASKIFRFGLDECWPEKTPTNREKLEIELGDLIAMIKILEEQGIISGQKLIDAHERKIEKLTRAEMENAVNKSIIQ